VSPWVVVGQPLAAVVVVLCKMAGAERKMHGQRLFGGEERRQEVRHSYMAVLP